MAINTFSKADIFYRKIIRNTFFSKGWGDLTSFKKLRKLKYDIFNAEKFKEIVNIDKSNCIIIDKIRHVKDSYSVIDGHFLSPIAQYYPELLPKESEIARFQAIVPKTSQKQPAMCVLLAGTGDHYYWRRRHSIAKPLVKENSIGSVMLINPYYGSRKPKSQTGSSLNHVLDLFIMGCALIVETSVLLNWCELQGYGPLGVSGVSMGGHMASLAATFVPKPIAIVPCLSWTTASTVFTKGVLSKSIAWPVLENQLKDITYLEELCSLCEDVEQEGIDARQCDVARSRLEYLPNFAEKLINLTNKETESSVDFQLNFLNMEPSYVSYDASARKQQETFTKNKSILFNLTTQYHNSMKYKKAKLLMKHIMDIMTHLGYYKPPFDANMAVFVEAEFDGYIPRTNCLSPLQLWPGCQVKYTKGGHVATALYKQDIFRKTIAETITKLNN